MRGIMNVIYETNNGDHFMVKLFMLDSLPEDLPVFFSQDDLLSLAVLPLTSQRVSRVTQAV